MSYVTIISRTSCAACSGVATCTCSSKCITWPTGVYDQRSRSTPMICLRVIRPIKYSPCVTGAECKPCGTKYSSISRCSEMFAGTVIGCVFMIWPTETPCSADSSSTSIPAVRAASKRNHPMKAVQRPSKKSPVKNWTIPSRIKTYPTPWPV